MAILFGTRCLLIYPGRLEMQQNQAAARRLVWAKIAPPARPAAAAGFSGRDDDDHRPRQPGPPQ